MKRNLSATCLASLLTMWLFSISAPAAELQFRFRDVAKSSGLAKPLQGMMGHAAAWGDVNNDGWLDLFVGTFADRPAIKYRQGGATGPVPNLLLLNQRGKFQQSKQPSIAHKGRASGSVLADFDNDGKLDLYVANNGRLGKENKLYRNLGGGQFKDVTSQAGAPVQRPATARSATVLDFDGDGLLDLLVLATVNRGSTHLFRNRGAMRFEVSKAIPADAVGLGVAVGDLTGNGWPDVMIGGCNRLFVNLGRGRFREADELQLKSNFTREDDSSSCGIAFGDFDRDGKTDMLIGSHHKSPWKKPNSIRLFRNLGSSPTKVRMIEVTKQVGLLPYPMKVPHVEIRDFDNDGWPDLYTAVVTMRDGRIYPAIYRNRGSASGKLPQFTESAFVHRRDFPDKNDYVPGERSRSFYERLVRNRKVMYFAPGPSSDFDNDGRLDLFLPSWFPMFGSLLLRNETKSGNYLDVQVIGRRGVNRMGIGCVVRAYRSGKAGNPSSLLASEEISTGYGFCSAQAAVAHLGLGTQTVCDLVISLPHGKGRIVRRQVKANQRLRVPQFP